MWFVCIIQTFSFIYFTMIHRMDESQMSLVMMYMQNCPLWSTLMQIMLSLWLPVIGIWQVYKLSSEWDGMKEMLYIAVPLQNRYFKHSGSTISYYHHQIGSMNYYPLFRVRSWNNDMRCMSLYILINTIYITTSCCHPHHWHFNTNGVYIL